MFPSSKHLKSIQFFCLRPEKIPLPEEGDRSLLGHLSTESTPTIYQTRRLWKRWKKILTFNVAQTFTSKKWKKKRKAGTKKQEIMPTSLWTKWSIKLKVRRLISGFKFLEQNANWNLVFSEPVVCAIYFHVSEEGTHLSPFQSVSTSAVFQSNLINCETHSKLDWHQLGNQNQSQWAPETPTCSLI